MKKIIELVTSRKFLLTVGAIATVIGTEGKAGAWKAVTIFLGWLAAQGAVDVAAKMNPPTK